MFLRAQEESLSNCCSSNSKKAIAVIKITVYYGRRKTHIAAAATQKATLSNTARFYEISRKKKWVVSERVMLYWAP